VQQEALEACELAAGWAAGAISDRASEWLIRVPVIERDLAELRRRDPALYRELVDGEA
jgi:hypothetical protein